MNITVDDPRIRMIIRKYRKLRAQGTTKAAISTALGVAGLKGLSSAEKTVVLASIPA